MRHVGFTYTVQTKHKNGKPKLEYITSHSTRKVSFIRRKGGNLPVIQANMTYEIVKPAKKAKVSK